MGNNNRWQVEGLCEAYVKQEAAVEKERKELDELRKDLIDLVLRKGCVPARAAKTLALAGVLYEARVSRPVEITVDTQVANEMRILFRKSGTMRLLNKLFRRVETFVLADGADDFLAQRKLPAGVPKNIRTLFARALRIRALSPQLEVRKIERKEKAA